MSPEAQRIAIAQACGWGNDPQWIADCVERHRIESERAYYQERPAPTGGVPDYLNDLNAMREVEKSMLFSVRQRYHIELQAVMSKALPPGELVHISEGIHASAAQKSEAFLKAKNLWTTP